MFRVLFVCTGNICRSPTADGVLRHRIAERDLGAVLASDSAGTHGYHIGEPPDPRTVETARRAGYDLSGLRARRFETRDADEFDLIVAMDDGHFRSLAPRIGAGMRATLVHFMDYAPGFGVRDVPDPYYGTQGDFDRVLEMVETGVSGLLDSLERSIGS